MSRTAQGSARFGAAARGSPLGAAAPSLNSTNPAEGVHRVEGLRGRVSPSACPYCNVLSDSPGSPHLLLLFKKKKKVQVKMEMSFCV